MGGSSGPWRTPVLQNNEVTVGVFCLLRCHLAFPPITANNCILFGIMLTHWGRVMHISIICLSKLTIIGSDNGLWPGQRESIVWTSAGILLIGPSGINLSEILVKILTFSFQKLHLKMSSVKWRPFCLGFNVLTLYMLNWIQETQIYTQAFCIIPQQSNGLGHWNKSLMQTRTCLYLHALLMTWWCKEPGHQQAWYWISLYRIFWLSA